MPFTKWATQGEGGERHGGEVGPRGTALLTPRPGFSLPWQPPSHLPCPSQHPGLSLPQNGKPASPEKIPEPAVTKTWNQTRVPSALLSILHPVISPCLSFSLGKMGTTCLLLEVCWEERMTEKGQTHNRGSTCEPSSCFLRARVCAGKYLQIHLRPQIHPTIIAEP